MSILINPFLRDSLKHKDFIENQSVEMLEDVKKLLETANQLAQTKQKLKRLAQTVQICQQDVAKKWKLAELAQARAQASEGTLLKELEQVELLTKEVELLTKEVELLTKEVELLTKNDNVFADDNRYSIWLCVNGIEFRICLVNGRIIFQFGKTTSNKQMKFVRNIILINPFLRDSLKHKDFIENQSVEMLEDVKKLLETANQLAQTKQKLKRLAQTVQICQQDVAKELKLAELAQARAQASEGTLLKELEQVELLTKEVELLTKEVELLTKNANPCAETQ